MVDRELPAVGQRIKIGLDAKGFVRLAETVLRVACIAISYPIR